MVEVRFPLGHTGTFIPDSRHDRGRTNDDVFPQPPAVYEYSILRIEGPHEVAAPVEGVEKRGPRARLFQKSNGALRILMRDNDFSPVKEVRRDNAAEEGTFEKREDENERNEARNDHLFCGTSAFVPPRGGPFPVSHAVGGRRWVRSRVIRSAERQFRPANTVPRRKEHRERDEERDEPEEIDAQSCEEEQRSRIGEIQAPDAEEEEGGADDEQSEKRDEFRAEEAHSRVFDARDRLGNEIAVDAVFSFCEYPEDGEPVGIEERREG